MTRSVEGFIAVNRFGLGAKPGELAEASIDSRAWLRAQLSPETEHPAQLAGLAPSSEIIATLREMKAAAPGRAGLLGNKRSNATTPLSADGAGPATVVVENKIFPGSREVPGLGDLSRASPLLAILL